MQQLICNSKYATVKMQQFTLLFDMLLNFVTIIIIIDIL